MPVHKCDRAHPWGQLRNEHTQLMCYTRPHGELLLASTFYWRTVKTPNNQTDMLVMSNCLPEPDQTPWFCLYKSDQMRGSSTLQYVWLLCTEQVTLGLSSIQCLRWLSGWRNTGQVHRLSDESPTCRYSMICSWPYRKLGMSIQITVCYAVASSWFYAIVK